MSARGTKCRLVLNRVRWDGFSEDQRARLSHIFDVVPLRSDWIARDHLGIWDPVPPGELSDEQGRRTLHALVHELSDIFMGMEVHLKKMEVSEDGREVYLTYEPKNKIHTAELIIGI